MSFLFPLCQMLKLMNFLRLAASVSASEREEGASFHNTAFWPIRVYNSHVVKGRNFVGRLTFSLIIEAEYNVWSCRFFR